MTTAWHGPAAWEGPGYDVTAALDAETGADDPAADKIADLPMSPPSPSEIMAQTERLVFSD